MNSDEQRADRWERLALLSAAQGPRWIYTNPNGVAYTAFYGDSIRILQIAAQS